MDDCELRRWVCAWAAKYPSNYDEVMARFAGRAALTGAEIDEVVAWKFGNVPNRLSTVRRSLARFDECYLVDVVARAIHSNDDLSGMLLLLAVVGKATASAILAVTNPDRYTVFDVRANKSLITLGLMQTDPCKGEWLNYLESCRAVARRTAHSLRTVDQALYKANGNPGLPPGPLPECC